MNNRFKKEDVTDSVDADSTASTTKSSKSQPMDKGTFERLESVALIDSLGCLVENFMQNYLYDLLDISDKIASLSLDTIAFEDLWQLFRPGTTIIQNGNPMSYHKQQAYNIFHVEAPFSEAPYRDPNEMITLYCYSLAYDGITFRPVEKIFRVYPYHGFKDIRHLSVLPVKFAADLESKLRTRGRNFLAHRYGHRRYTGRTESIHEIPEECIDEDVFIDFELGFRYSHSFKAHLERAHPKDGFWFSCDKNSVHSVLGDACRRCQRKFFNDAVQDLLLSEKFCHGFRAPTWTEGQPPESDENQEMLLPPWLIAMSLSSQEICRYLRFQAICFSADDFGFPDALSAGLVAGIEPKPSRISLNNVVLPSRHKSVLIAAVNHSNPENPGLLSDTMTATTATSSGQGLTVLLHGPPGSGKVRAHSNST